ncbi:MAG TPA: 3D domain-containing protein [Pyrinomonadaceae bacterium]|nr:3D domain-containing protein [Pyrinomonadaceae bacterium]
MKKSTFIGSTVSVLLLFSVISYSRTYIQQQDPKPAQPNQSTVPQANAATGTTESPEVKDANSAMPVDAKPSTTASAVPVVKDTEPVVLAENYTATAYSLRGRTASGKPVARGVIAADPRVLPLGTRVRIDAGDFSGEYVVADTGGAVKGRRVDIWTPTAREAMRFGRRAVKLTVLERGGKRKNASVPPRRVTTVPSTITIDPGAKQNQ